MKKRLTTLLSLSLFFLTITPVWSMTTGMRPLQDSEMRGVTGQGLIVSDYIQGDALAGANEYSTPFDFYRIGLDGELALNLNISKLQLGCGGVNDFLSGHAGCDIDIDYASLMGRNGTALGAPGSAFKLLRPYIEFAVKNDDTATMREIAGIKIGAQSADGAISAGRRYFTNGAINQENTALATTCDPGASTGNGVLGCHSGINSVSGFLGAELSISMRVQASICTGFDVFGGCLGIPIPLDAWGCTGRTQFANDPCGTSLSDALFVDIAGTRMQTLGLRAAKLRLDGNGFSEVITTLLNNAYAQLRTDLRTVHKLTFEDTPDFFISFQREPIAYPRYTKNTPNQDLIGTEFDSCNTGYATPRCNSAYAVPANTGWWLNAPSVKLLDVLNESANLGTLFIDDALELLAAPGYLIENPEFELTPAKNCYGSSNFC